MSNESKYPEHDKLDKLMNDEFCLLNEFAEYLDNGSSYALFKQISNEELLEGVDYMPTKVSDVIYEFLGVDPNKLEEERKQIIEDQIKMQK